MTISKVDLIIGTYSLIRISGLTVDPSPEDLSIALSVADDYASELKGGGLDLGWLLPATYGDSDANDTSGLTPEMAGPFKKLMAMQLLGHFGKDVPPIIAKISADGMRALEHIVVSVPDAANPSTLPFGSGNEQDYRDRQFYNEPATNNGAIYVFKNDALTYNTDDSNDTDFTQWLEDETLATVTWEEIDGGITISNETFTDTVASALLTFDKLGGYTVCITATKTNSNDIKTLRKNFIIKECNTNGLTFSV